MLSDPFVDSESLHDGGSPGQASSINDSTANESVAESFAALVQKGLESSPRWLPTRFLYDERGSEIFEEITSLDEYYLTRAEAEILQAHAGEILAQAGATEIVELGSGSSAKTLILLQQLAQRGGRRYLPIDISGDFLEKTAIGLREQFPSLEIQPVVGEYFTALGRLPSTPNRRLFLLLGSNIGNFEPDEAIELLRSIRKAMSERDSLLIGMDLVKAESKLLLAYDDPQGVTARFTINLLARMNRELGADFDLSAWRHAAYWRAEEDRIEICAESLRDQSVRIDALETVYTFGEGECVHTEWSQKYTRATADRVAKEAGFRIARWWTDAEDRFASALWELA